MSDGVYGDSTLVREEASHQRSASRVTRLRRLRRTPGLRSLVREAHLDVGDVILPLFVTAGEDVSDEIESMPGIFRESVEHTATRAEQAAALGIGAVILFGVPERKDALGSGGYDADGAVQRAARALRDRCPDLVIATDTCLCEYTDHGHCGVLDERLDVDNDATLAVLGRVAVSQAASGADLVAPSGMIDGQVAGIRAALDDAGYQHVGIMSYSAKYASAFYGPFRDAAQGAPTFGDRRGLQMDPANGAEAVREAVQDVVEGADLIMVKPALAYLDIVRRLRLACEGVPLVAYNVSGEYAMLKAAATAGWVDERAAVFEALTSMRRAGADLVITYHAMDVARWLLDAS